MKKSILYLVAIIVLACTLLAPVSAFAATEPTLPMPHAPSIPSTENASIDSPSVDESASSAAEEASHEALAKRAPSVRADMRIIDPSGDIVEELDKISRVAGATTQIYTVVYEFYISGGNCEGVSVALNRPTTSDDYAEWECAQHSDLDWHLRSENSVSESDYEMIYNSHWGYSRQGPDDNFFIRTIPNSTYLFTPELPNGTLLSDRDLARQEIGATIGFSSLDGKIPGGRDNLCTIAFQLAVSTKEESLVDLTENTISAIAKYNGENTPKNPNDVASGSSTASPAGSSTSESSPASSTASSASESGATNALILHAVVDVLMILGASLILLYAMNFYKQEILAEILTLRDQLSWPQEITKNADLPVADVQRGYDAPTPDDLDELGVCFYAWLRTYN